MRRISIVICVLLFLAYLNKKEIYKVIVVVFRKDAVISSFDENGNPEGKWREYVDGQMVFEQVFVNGLREGEALRYYQDGKLRQKAFFFEDQFHGKQSGYYQNGKLKYSVVYRYGKPHGSGYFYSKDGKLESYKVYNLNGDNFCTFRYDKNAKLVEMNGLVVNTLLYSTSTESKSTVIFDNQTHGYSKIEDLYFTVATPPNCRLKLEVTINNRLYNNLSIKDNTVIIRNAFPLKGTYEIFIESHLLSEKGEEINGINLKSVVIRQD